MPEDDKAGASSTPEELNAASDAALAGSDFERYSAVENARDQGKALPEAPPPSKETSDKTPAPEPGTDKPIQEKKPKTGEDRKVELAAEIKDMLRQRAELKAELEGKTPGVKVAEPPPAVIPPVAKAAEVAKPAAAGEAPKRPKLDDFPTYAEFDVAKDEWFEAMIAFRAKELLATHDTRRAADDANAAAGKVWDAKVAAAKEEHADFAEVAFSKDTPITDAMDGFILESEHGARILYELGKDGSAEGKRIAALSPFAAVRALIAIEGKLEPAANDDKNVVPITTPVKKHTAAPAPATDLGGRNAEPGDAALAALNRGDTAEYMRLMNARDIAARRAA